jgi:hypothetical protein
LYGQNKARPTSTLSLSTSIYSYPWFQRIVLWLRMHILVSTYSTLVKDAYLKSYPCDACVVV